MIYGDRNIREYEIISWHLDIITIKNGDPINRGGICCNGRYTGATMGSPFMVEISAFRNFHHLETCQFDGAKFLLKRS